MSPGLTMSSATLNICSFRFECSPGISCDLTSLSYIQSEGTFYCKNADSVKFLKPCKVELLDFVNTDATLATCASIPPCMPKIVKEKVEHNVKLVVF